MAGRHEAERSASDVGQSIGDRVIRRVTSTSDFIRRLHGSWRRPWLPRLTLPADSDRVQTIGRSADCDLVVSDPTVSRRHAQLRPRPQGWELADLGSTNGTRLNGWRLGVAQALRPGDVVTFGGMSFAVVDAPLQSSLETAAAGAD
jgi:FHA domain